MERLCKSYVDFPVIAAHEDADLPICEGLQAVSGAEFCQEIVMLSHAEEVSAGILAPPIFGVSHRIRWI